MTPGGRITTAMVARSRTVAEPRWSPTAGRLGWLEASGQRVDLLLAPGDGGGPPAVVTADFPVAPAGAYGGGTWCFAGDDAVVVAGRDGRLVVRSADGLPLRVLVRDGHALAPAVSSRGEVACSIERDDACDVAVVPLDGGAWPVRISHADYAWDPVWSPDGRRLAWHEWDLPDMPWDGSRIVVHDRDTGASTVVAGGEGVAVGQPRFSPDGTRLAWVSDATGWTNVWCARADGGEAAPVLAERHEHAEPSWGPGQRSFAWSPDGTHVAWNRNEDGFGRLVVGSPGRRSARELSKGWHTGIDWSVAGIVVVRSGAKTPSQVTVLAADGSARRTVARGPVAGFEAAGLVEPKAVTWRSQGATVHGLLYLPAAPALGPGTRPPLLVQVHGGPTDQSRVAWQAETAFWVDRGYAVLRPNPRGSTGYGRAYAQALANGWGERDVADIAAGIRHAGKEGWCDPLRVAVRGGSSGGLAVLMLCAQHGDVVRAGVAYAAVTDLAELTRVTHRFESGYLDRLVGVLPQDAARYRDHSPLTHAASIRVPVLLVHGADDVVVPRAQAESMADAMRRAGAPVELVVYDDEGHSLRGEANVEDALARSESFLRRHLLER